MIFWGVVKNLLSEAYQAKRLEEKSTNTPLHENSNIR